MGTLFRLVVYAPAAEPAEAAAGAAWKRVDALEDVMSDYQADSELMRLCDQPPGRPVAVSADLFDVLQKAERVSALSGGAFDVTVGPYVRLWRFARKRRVLPSPGELAAAAEVVGYRKLALDAQARTVTLLVPGMRLDLGGIGKGYAADAALRVLRDYGLPQALVAASGDIALGQAPPGQAGWRISVAEIGGSRVSFTTNSASVLVLHDAGISTSGDTEQFIEINGVRYSHVIDPATGLGLTNRLQATVVARDATTTDSLDNTLCVLGVARGLALADSLPHTAALIKDGATGQMQGYPSRRFRHLAGRP